MEGERGGLVQGSRLMGGGLELGRGRGRGGGKSRTSIYQRWEVKRREDLQEGMLDVCAGDAVTLTFEPSAATTTHNPSGSRTTALPQTDGDRQMDVRCPGSGRRRRRQFGVMLLNSSQHNSGCLVWTAGHGGARGAQLPGRQSVIGLLNLY